MLTALEVLGKKVVQVTKKTLPYEVSIKMSIYKQAIENFKKGDPNSSLGIWGVKPKTKSEDDGPEYLSDLD